ncbi:MAG: hypothetical protein WBF66_08920 [Dehalococcoidia bacterium]
MTETPIPNHIYEGDCLEVMRRWPDACVDHCSDGPFYSALCALPRWNGSPPDAGTFLLTWLRETSL